MKWLIQLAMIALCAVLARANVPYLAFLPAMQSISLMLTNALTAAAAQAYALLTLLRRKIALKQKGTSFDVPYFYGEYYG